MSAATQLADFIAASPLQLIRFVWCDPHGTLRAKALTAKAACDVLRSGAGVGMVSTLMLKDTSDKTAFKVFEASITQALPGFEFANNLILQPVPDSFRVLPWAQQTGWILCEPQFQNGQPVPFDTRSQLRQALARLSQRGLGMTCGLEIEFHIYKLHNPDHGDDLNPDHAAWPGDGPAVSMIHPGYQLLSEHWLDVCEEPLRIVQQTAQGLGLPLVSLEIEMGPSQVEAVFAPTDALTAADNMVRFRSAARQALRRAGYHATFVCRPPFEQIMSSGWHLHQSLVDLETGTNAFMRDAPASDTTAKDATHTLSALGAHYLAGLLAHANGATVLCTPTANGYARFQPNALAPQSVVWGRDNRGAMLRVIGGANDASTRIENRLGEPAANPYLYLASQIHAGLAGIEGALEAPLATESPYDDTAQRNPNSLGAAISAFEADTAMRNGFGEAFINYYAQLKKAEFARFEAATDKNEFQRREYFSRL